MKTLFLVNFSEDVHKLVLLQIFAISDNLHKKIIALVIIRNKISDPLLSLHD